MSEKQAGGGASTYIMSPELHVIDLLQWAKDHRIQPLQPRSKDIYLEPISKRLIRHRDMMPHQRRTALWVPNRRGLRELGLKTVAERQHEIMLLKSGTLTGFGKGEHEAAMSLLSQMRRALAA